MLAVLALKLHADGKREASAVQAHRKSSIVLNLKRPPPAGADRAAYFISARTSAQYTAAGIAGAAEASTSPPGQTALLSCLGAGEIFTGSPSTSNDDKSTSLLASESISIAVTSPSGV